MKFKDLWKRFLTPDPRHSAGFTLVELVVVIAVLGILGGVAVPAYGGYVTKANKTADQTLVSEVADALTLYYYSHPTDAASGYVVLTQEGDVCAYDSNGVGKAAMDAVFGDGWENTLSLKYDGWEADSATFAALMSGPDAKTVKNSEFANVSSATLLNDVQTIVNAAATFLGGQDKDKKLDLVKKAVGGEAEYTELCDNLGVDSNNISDTELSNLLVFAVAAGASDTENTTGIETLATEYASYVAYAYSSDEPAVQEAYETMIASMNTAESEDDIEAALNNFKTTTGWTDYESTANNGTNQEAFGYIMQAVDAIPSLTDGDLKDGNYFLNNGIDEQLDTYMAAIDMVAGWGDEEFRSEIAKIGNGITVFLYVTSNGIYLDCTSTELLAR